MTLGQRISTNRKQLGIPQEELGARLGVSRQAVSKWENDLTVPDMTNLLGLAREFGISVAELTETPVETPFQKSPHGVVRHFNGQRQSSLSPTPLAGRGHICCSAYVRGTFPRPFILARRKGTGQ